VPSAVSVRLRGIWFPVRTPSSGWDVVPANGPDGFFPNLFWPAAESLPARYQHSPGTPLNDTLTFEVAAGATVSGNPEVLLDAVRSLDSPAVQTVIADF
jgi:hypothetical protein